MIWIYIIGTAVLLFGFVVAFGAPYVPSHRRDVRRVLGHLGIKKGDVVVDVGSGDGIVLREIAKRGARAIGYELNPLLVGISKIASLRFPFAKTILANMWRVDFPEKTNYVYAFSVNRDRHRLAAKIQEQANRLRHPVTLICYGSPFEERKPDETFEAYSIYRFHPLQPQKAQV